MPSERSKSVENNAFAPSVPGEREIRLGAVVPERDGDGVGFAAVRQRESVLALLVQQAVGIPVSRPRAHPLAVGPYGYVCTYRASTSA
jgi:hypothetical protein